MASAASSWIILILRSFLGKYVGKSHSQNQQNYSSYIYENLWMIVYCLTNAYHSFLNIFVQHHWLNESFYFLDFWLWIIWRLFEYILLHTSSILSCHWLMLQAYSIWYQTFFCCRERALNIFAQCGIFLCHWAECFYFWLSIWPHLTFKLHLFHILYLNFHLALLSTALYFHSPLKNYSIINLLTFEHGKFMGYSRKDFCPSPNNKILNCNIVPFYCSDSN